MAIHDDLQRLADEAQQQVRVFETILSATADFNYIFDRKGRFSYVNKALCDLLQKTQAEVIGKDFHELGYPKDLAKTLQGQIEQVFLTAKDLTDETPFTDPDGNTGYYEYIFVPVLGKKGNVVAVAGSTRDITKHKQAQAALQASETRFKQVAETSTFGLIIGDTQGGLHYANPFMRNLLGYTEAEIIEGKVRWDRLTPAGYEKADANAIAEAKATGRCTPYEKEYLAKNGRRVPVLVGGSILATPPGTPIEVAAFVIDLSEVRTAQAALLKSESNLAALNKDLEKRVAERSEELELKAQQLVQAQKLEAVGRLSAGIAHDFNNLITGIAGIAADVIDQLGPKSPLTEELDEIIKASQKAALLTKQLLAFGRRQVGTQRVLNFNKVIADMSRLLERILGETVTLDLALDYALGQVRSDPSHLEQVVVNLAINARDAMPQGGTLRIETANIELTETSKERHFQAKPGSYIMLSITDTGTGMTSETLNKIFEPFFTTKDQGKGTGLGLATVYGIIKQNSGDIAVSTQVGKGTTFRIYLPRVFEPEEEVVENTPAPAQERGAERILIVEDEDIVRRVTVRALEKAGYIVFQAASGQEALDLMKETQGPLDLLITDVVMPGLNGREVADQLLAKQPDLGVLFMSGHPRDILSQKKGFDGTIAFIEKSFTAAIFCKKVREVLDSRKPAKKPTAQ